MSNRNRAPSPTTEEKRVLDSKDKLSKMSKEYNEIGEQLKSLLEKKENTILSKVPGLEDKESILSDKKNTLDDKAQLIEDNYESSINNAETVKNNLIQSVFKTKQAALTRAKERYDEAVRAAEESYDKAEQFAEIQYNNMINKAERVYKEKKGSIKVKDRSVAIQLSSIERKKEIVTPALQKQLYDSWARMENLRKIMVTQCLQQSLNYPIPDLPERPCDPPAIPAIPQMISPEVADFYSTLGTENAITAEERRRAQDEERRVREASDREYEERMMKIAMEQKKRDQEELERRRAINKRRAEEIQEPPPATEEIGVAVNLYRRKREVTIGDD